MQYHLEAVHPEPSTQLQSEAIAFWRENGALDDSEAAARRAKQLLVVARDAEGQLIGVSTCQPTMIDRLGFPCFYYRSFIGKQHRSHGLRGLKLAQKILTAAHKHLNNRFLEGCDPNVLGLYLQVESESIRRNRNDLIWTDDGMNCVYIGRNESGHHLRAYYFDGARMDGRRRPGTA